MGLGGERIPFPFRQNTKLPNVMPQVPQYDDVIYVERLETVTGKGFSFIVLIMDYTGAPEGRRVTYASTYDFVQTFQINPYDIEKIFGP